MESKEEVEVKEVGEPQGGKQLSKCFCQLCLEETLMLKWLECLQQQGLP